MCACMPALLLLCLCCCLHTFMACAVPPQWTEHGPSGASGRPAAQSAHTGAAVSAWRPHPRTEAVTAAGRCLTPRTAPTGCVCRVSARESGDRPLCPCPALGGRAHPEQSSPQGLCLAPHPSFHPYRAPHDLLDHPCTVTGVIIFPFISLDR